MGRYTKIASKYILAKYHQDTSQGTLFERDWTTIGNVHRLEPGKRAVYGSSNFIFTESTIPVYKKKWKNGKWVGSYVYEDVMGAEDIVNKITVNTDSENLSDYAYWGSMTELFRGSVEHIIKTFPGRLRSSKKKLAIHHHWPNDPTHGNNEWWTNAPGYILGNPFGLDMHTDTDEDIDVDDLLKYVALSWEKYVVEDYERGNVVPITSYRIYPDYIEYDCEHRYFRLCNIIVFYENDFLIVDTYLVDGKIVYCYRTKDDEEPVDPDWFQFIIEYYSGLLDVESSRSSSVSTRDGVLTIDLSDWYVPEDFAICPNADVVEIYFRTLEGFEWKLLNRQTKPYYKNTFLLPVQLQNGNWKLVRRVYTWPSEGMWIDIESTDYDSFINSMVELCGVYDNLWCDSIWRCMVHESVKNFDWSYRREYEDNDAIDNIEGGNRMKDVMRLYGIIYDTAKRYVDGISMYNTVTYDGYNNCPNAQISDRNILQGWDITSTQHQFYWYEKITKYVSGEGYTPLPVLPVNVDEESPELVSVTCPKTVDTEYYIKKTTPVSEISLDTQFYNETIVDKQQNPWVGHNVYGRLYTEVGYASVTPGYDFSQPYATFNEYPYQLFDGINYQDYVLVLSNNGKRYYELLPNDAAIETNNENYVNGVWFESVNENVVTTATTDILFNRMLNLSSNRILKTKGTKESIEMVFALFGFGKYDENENPYGDYTIEEQYGKYTAKEYDSTFYFYEEITPEEAEGHTVETVDSLPVNPDAESDEYIMIETVIDSDSSYDTYYKLNGEYTVAEVIKLLYAHRTTERVYDDYYSGVPIKDVYNGNEHLIVPFMDNSRTYEGNPYFEGKGGWMNTGENTWDYTETIPYLHILQRISDLFSVNTNGVNNGDIYFVADVSDYYEYTPNVPYYLSNYFKLKDKYNSTRFSSWVNVPIEGPIQNGGYSGIDGVTREDYLHAKHLDTIIPSILFNNPHCGYDRYDMGDNFKDLMSRPYRYSSDNELYDDEYYANMASQFKFESVYEQTQEDDGKMVVTAETVVYDEQNDELLIDNLESENEQTEPENTNYALINDKYLKITLYDNGAAIVASNPDYRMHLEYMRNVIMKYVAQVIPSTTILVLTNFITPEDISDRTAVIATAVNGEGVVYGAGTYLQTSMVTLKAVPADGWHFVGWRGVSGRSTWSSDNNNTQLEPFGGYEDTLTVMACGNKTYTAVFAEDCGIGFGCKIMDCGGSPTLST